jgi:ketosteroid isomerase-like protein
VSDSANLDLVHSVYQRRDFGSADSNDDPAFFDRIWRDYLDEEYEYRGTGGYPEGELVFRGREGAAQLLAMLLDAWAEFRFEPERFIGAGDQVVAFVRWVGKGRASGVPIELPVAHVWTIRDGRLKSCRAFRDRSDALEAVGLSRPRPGLALSRSGSSAFGRSGRDLAFGSAPGRSCYESHRAGRATREPQHYPVASLPQRCVRGDLVALQSQRLRGLRAVIDHG